ncbi:sulfotransferase [Novosphingobium sp. P6W]|uniref:sulfotransferase family protein n=1 Tax=Novosphingobium sp. P6W TaxID=1609758 RepID=UPI0005C778E9|nr:sulfotransferase [Novosphingobium sp. P6W]AXB80249.1 sulfotransferase [Novosphingobium sp. P6W]
MVTRDGTAETVALSRDFLIQQARDRANLDDLGDTWFFEPMDRFLQALNAEGKLTDAGRAATAEVVVKGLTSRLRMVEDIRLHPEILDEKVDVAGIILGLPRTGSTIFQRLLASAPGMTAMRWYELQNFAPLPGEVCGVPDERRAYAQSMIEGWLELAPELASIHPLDPDAPDEEILVLGQMFVSTMVEGMNFVPSFAKWLNSYDQAKGHEDLRTILKYLQWQDPSRRSSKWILKSPSNLPYAEVAARAFPEALLIMTHRDPVETVPSYVSMQAALYKLTSSVTDEEVGRFWFSRLVEWMRMFEEARTRIGEDRFIDIDYREVGRDPMYQGRRVLERIGIPVDDRLDAALTEFLAGNKREQRPLHEYSLERFGLSETAIKREFAAYRQRFIL